MSSDAAGYWETIYESRNPTEVSWYEPMPRHSLERPLPSHRRGRGWGQQSRAWSGS